MPDPREGAAYLSVTAITEAFIERFGNEYERPLSTRDVGHLLRNRLRLVTYKRHGNFVLPTTQTAHLPLLAERYGVITNASAEQTN